VNQAIPPRTAGRFPDLVGCVAAGCFAGLALVAAEQPPQFDVPPPRDAWVKVPVTETAEWPRHFRIGMMMGINLKADFSMSGRFPVSGSQPGPAGGGVDHIYDDGYVRVDDTGNAQGFTSYWGYDNPAQYDPVAHTLTFHSASSFTTSGSSEAEDSPYIGFELAYGGHLGRWGRALYGWEFGFGLLPISIPDKQPKVASLEQTVHTFDAGSILLPTGPYHGGPSGDGQPTIHDAATPQSTNTVFGTVTGTQTLKAMLYVARLGPALHWELHPRWAVSLGAGPAVGFVDGEIKFDEILTSVAGSGRNTGKITGSELVYGGYVNAALMYHAEQNGDFYVGVQYMPLSSMSINGDGREARLNLAGGIYFSVGFNWPF